MISGNNNLASHPVLLVTGAAGFLGSAVVAQALSRGWIVRATVRHAEDKQALPSSVTSYDLDLTADGAAWRNIMKGVDVVIHAAARAHVIRETAADPAKEFADLNFHATEKIAQAAAECGVRRFVFVSSIGVCGNTSGRSPFTESSPSCPVSMYAVSKQYAEDAVLKIAKAGAMESVVVRPPLVYGPAVKANFLRLLRIVDRELPLPFRGVRNNRSFIYVDNLADLLLTCAEHPAAAGETFLAADGSDFSTPQLMIELARRMRRRTRLFYAPVILLKTGAFVLRRSAVFEQLCCSLEVDGSKAADRLDWRPPVPAARRLDATIGWYLKHGRS